VKQANGLFQYTKVACRIIEGGEELLADRLKMVLNSGQSRSLKVLDDIYLKALEFAIPIATNDDQDNFF
jgi:hypothetical protein